MNAEEVWKSLVTESVENRTGLKTKRGLHFKLVSNGEFLTVYKSEMEPSSKLKSPALYTKIILKKSFLTMKDGWLGKKG
ncbi:hypothetical protein [Psychrobacillus vulpis]|uniref:Uncharacterized protein n=1 Tax=Psychrobacillus vulpis TaxID=2325572 RepID=A0A544TR59_9BACI|nr:hypothetical protein [Psychrobacillus vulpis]TQR19930.1 hypothetical protein FG384_09710 [Psychrobacillus vulpis]